MGLGETRLFSDGLSGGVEHGFVVKSAGVLERNRIAGFYRHTNITGATRKCCCIEREQALCIARSLVEQQAFDPADVAKRFVAWYVSDPFDTGHMTIKSLSRLKHRRKGRNRPARLGGETPVARFGQTARHRCTNGIGQRRDTNTNAHCSD
ncbi:ADP-ribosylglycohydrolase family protein [Halorubrum sp. N11]|uniref:ADP-ribosylglycohydrolase family protein n=1 Tax=Halorubrum sp. N11 TaxID=3402276 RepID=UPI003EBEEE97